MSPARRIIRSAEIALAVIFGLTYILAKFNFYTHYGSADYFSRHWPYWAAMAGVLVLLKIFEAITNRFARLETGRMLLAFILTNSGD